MALREVLRFPDKRLAEVSEPIEEVTDEIRELANDMPEVMYDEPGIGLAAPQVGQTVRLIVIDTEWTEEDAEKSPLVLVNPEIVQREGKLSWTEGCLSVPDYKAKVERSAEQVTLRATDLEGHEILERRRGAARRLHPARDRPSRRHPLHRPHQPPQATHAGPEVEEVKVGVRRSREGGSSLQERLPEVLTCGSPSSEPPSSRCLRCGRWLGRVSTWSR